MSVNGRPTSAARKCSSERRCIVILPNRGNARGLGLFGCGCAILAMSIVAGWVEVHWGIAPILLALSLIGVQGLFFSMMGCWCIPKIEIGNVGRRFFALFFVREISWRTVTAPILYVREHPLRDDHFVTIQQSCQELSVQERQHGYDLYLNTFLPGVCKSLTITAEMLG